MKLLNLLFTALLTIIVTASVNLAAVTAQDAVGPELIKIKMGEVYLPFKHWKHQKLTKSDCFTCHKRNEWKIRNWGKGVVHQICISCHEQQKTGPVECKDCHIAAYTSIQ